jgi:hypothetical protein
MIEQVVTTYNRFPYRAIRCRPSLAPTCKAAYRRRLERAVHTYLTNIETRDRRNRWRARRRREKA